MKLTPQKFLIIAALIFLITVVSANWNEVKAAATKKLLGEKGTGKAGEVIDQATGGTPGAGTAASAAVPKTSGRNYDKVLSKGSYTPLTGEVKELQMLLNQVNAIKKAFPQQLSTDNNFGAKTEAMLAFYAGVKQITLNQAYTAIQKAFGL